jgi:hypothetical protein
MLGVVMLVVVMMDVIMLNVTASFEWSLEKVFGEHCCVITFSPESNVLKHFE